MSNAYEEWKRLCEEHKEARDDVNEALKPVNNKFVDIADGHAQRNPSDEELDQLEDEWKKWDDVKQRMKEFIEKHR